MEVSFPGRTEPRRVEGRPPFARYPVHWIHEDRFYYGSGDRYEIAVHDLQGTVLSLIRKRVPNRPVTPAVVTAYKEQRLAAEATADPAGSARRRYDLDDLPYPDSLPAYRRLRVDRGGWLWVQDYDLASDTTVAWSIFDPAGRWITEMEVPRTWQITDIGADYILTIIRDDLDVEHVVKFALIRKP